MDIGHLLVHVADVAETAAVTEAAKRVESPAIPERFSLTQRVLVRMMRENTGASILDSGGAYGRAWQNNLSRDFGNVKAATLRGHVYTSEYSKPPNVPTLELDVTIDLFTYLASRLEYDRALTRQLQRFAALPENKDESWLAIAEAFPAWIANKRDADASEEWAGNSYNEDNYLSGTVQYVHFRMDHDEYVILQVHGGCDVRGGYTAPKVFRDDSNGCGSFGDWYQASLYPDHGEVEAIRAALKREIDRQPSLFPSVEAELRAEADAWGDGVYWDVGSNDDHGEGCDPLDGYPVQEVAERAEWRKGTICVLPSGDVLCPETGAILRADFCR